MTALITRSGSGSSAESEARYVEAIVELQQKLRFPGLVGAVRGLPDVHVVDNGFGLTTVAVPTEQLPLRYQLATGGFRLAQYLQAGYASPHVVMDQALFSEPISSWRPDDVHFLTLDSESGQILGYVTLVGHGESADGTRGRFPVEQAHGIDLFKAVGLPPMTKPGEVREIKRFVHLASMSDRRLRLRVSLNLLLAITRVIEFHQPGIIGLVGDVEAHVALRHLVLMGMRVVLVSGTTPLLSSLDLMHPMYDVRDKVEPFFTRVPEFAEIQRRRAVLETACASDNPFAAVSLLMKEMSGSVERIELDGARQS